MQPPQDRPTTSDRARTLLVDIGPLRLDPGYRRQWIAQTGSAIGRETARVAIPLHVFLLTDSAAALGLLAIFQLVPTLVFSLGGGALADAFDRRRLMAVAQASMAAASAVLLGLSLLADPPVIAIVVLAALISALFAIEHPARIASVPRLVPPERLSAAIALTSLNFQASSLIGPAVAGLLIVVAEIPGAYGLQTVAYCLAVIGTLRMPRLAIRGAAVRPSLAGVVDGLKFVRRQRIILAAMVMDLNAMVFALPIGLFPVLAIDVFGVGPAEVGFLAAARGGGAFIGGLLSGWIHAVRFPGRAVILVVLIFAGLTILLGIPGLPYWTGLVLVAIAGAADLSSAVLRNTIIQSVTTDDLRGRVTSLHVLAAQGGPRIGDLRAAVMADAIGAAPAVSIGGAVAVAGVAALSWVFPELRRHRLPATDAPGSSTMSADDLSGEEGQRMGVVPRAPTDG